MSMFHLFSGVSIDFGNFEAVYLENQASYGLKNRRKRITFFSSFQWRLPFVSSPLRCRDIAVFSFGTNFGVSTDSYRHKIVILHQISIVKRAFFQWGGGGGGGGGGWWGRGGGGGGVIWGGGGNMGGRLKWRGGGLFKMFMV
ncbi:hypothetical protein, partial [Bartonella sp. CL48QHWL]|uniref:hypothetical protein n=1 Tax=Bartonella sp. CL48QHWL TaxID=3243535 RepID=UPI0035CF0EB8